MQESIESKCEILKSIYSEAWSSATNYAKFVMVTGYAGYFGLVSITKDYISPICLLLSSTLLLISMTIFVFHEVFQIMSNTLHYSSKVKEAENRSVDGLINAQADQDSCDSRNHRVWFVCFILSAISGISAAIVLFYSIVATIIYCYQN